MCSRDMDRWIHFNMAIVGGFLGGFAILNHHELFGSAQTSNLISVFADFAGHPDANFVVRLIGVFIYMFALSLTVILPKFTKLHLPYISLFVDAMAALIVAFLPSDLNDFIALYPLYFAMAIQWCSFKGGDGFTCSTIFSTNNLRQFTTSMTEYLCSKDPDALRKWKFFACVLLSFHFGVIISYLSCKNLGQVGSLVCFLPVTSGFLLVYVRKNFVHVKHLVYRLLIAPKKSSAYISESE